MTRRDLRTRVDRLETAPGEQGGTVLIYDPSESLEALEAQVQAMHEAGWTFILMLPDNGRPHPSRR